VGFFCEDFYTDSCQKGIKGQAPQKVCHGELRTHRPQRAHCPSLSAKGWGSGGGGPPATQLTSSYLKALMDRAVADREVVMVRRCQGGDLALIAADELDGLLDTPHLLRSPRHADRVCSRLLIAPRQPRYPLRTGRPGGYIQRRSPSAGPWRLNRWPSASRSSWMTCSIGFRTIAAQQGFT